MDELTKEQIAEREAQQLDDEIKQHTLLEAAFYREKVGQMEHQIRLAEQADPPQTKMLAFDKGQRDKGLTQYEIHCGIRDSYMVELKKLEELAPLRW